jgi:hypothetical protein
MTSILFPILLSLIACSSSEAKQPSELNNSVKTTQKEVVTKEPDLLISTKNSLSVVVVEADKKYNIWMEGRSGVLRANVSDSFWIENGGVAIPQGSGQYNVEVDGHNYLTVKKNSKTPLKQKITATPENKTNLKLVLDMTDKGKYITQIHQPQGRTIKLATSDNKPTATAIITVSNKTDLYGASKSKLNGTEKASALKNNGIPSTAKIIPVKPPSKSTLQKWTNDIKSLYGGTNSFPYATMINLDNDESEEGFICATGSNVSKCFVIDTFKGQERYYISDFNWNTKGNQPTTFSTSHGTYVAHVQKLSKTTVTKVLRFDGSGYSTDRL